jgi:putative membrane protein
MKRLHLYCTLALMIGVLAIGYAASASSQNSFLDDAARGALAEVEMANLAMKKSADPAVKAFAQRLVTDHAVLSRDLTSLALKKEITLPPTLGNREKAGIDKLNTLSGAAFDAEFIRQIVKDHEIAIALYRRASARNTDIDIKEFAGNALPNLEAHLQTARSMNKTPANIKSNSNKVFTPSLGGANGNSIVISDTSNMAGHPNNPNANSHRMTNANTRSNVNR